MKIAFYVSRFPSLSETFILNQITGLIDRGHQVDIFADTPGDEDKTHGDVEKYALHHVVRYRPEMSRRRLVRFANGIRHAVRHGFRHPGAVIRSLNVIRYGWPAASLQLLYGAVQCLDSQRYDAIHCHFANNAMRAAYLREIGVLEGPMLTTFHGHDVNRYPRQHGRHVYRSLFASCELYTANTSFTAGQAVRLGCPEDRIIKLPMGIDLGAFPYKPRTREVTAPTKILTVGRLVEKKGIEYSIRAVARLAKEKDPVLYQIVGDGPLRPHLERLIEELDVSDSVALLGWKDRTELRSIFDQSHIFVLASVTARDGDREGQGVVLQEAQAMGLPVVSTLHNGIPEGVLEARSGFLVPERDVDSLAERMAQLMRNPQSWEAMGRAGRAFVEQHFDIDKLNDELVQIYRRLDQA